MATKYVCQLRRGIRYVDENGTTLLNADGTPIRDDWATYTAQENHTNPLDGELVVEFEYNPKTGKKTPRFKLGYDNNAFADLEYISPDSFVLPKQPKTINLPAEWIVTEGVPNTYEQDVTTQLIGLITVNSKIDLQPTPEQLHTLREKNIALTAVNDNGSVKVYAVGTKPDTACDDIPVTITEVICDA